MHAAREVGLDESEAVGERESELRDRVRAGLGDVVARDRHRVEVLHVVGDEVLLDVAHHLERELGGEDAGVLPLVLLEDVGLHRAAHRGQRFGLDLPQLFRTRLVAQFLDLLIDRGVEEHRQDRRRRSIDGHRHRSGRIAEIKARIQHLHVFQRGDRDPRVADLAVDVRPLVGIESIQGYGIERRRQPLRRQVLRQQVEAPVGAERIAFAREHARRVFVLALEVEHARSERELAGQVLAHAPAQKLAVVLEPRQRDLGHLGAGERGAGQLGA